MSGHGTTESWCPGVFGGTGVSQNTFQLILFCASMFVRTGREAKKGGKRDAGEERRKREGEKGRRGSRLVGGNCQAEGGRNGGRGLALIKCPLCVWKDRQKCQNNNIFKSHKPSYSTGVLRNENHQILLEI